MSTVLITGASSGIGLACAKQFAKQNHDVILLARRESRINELAASLSDQHGIQCHGLACDIRKQDAVKKTLASIPDHFSPIDCLVNNAGLAAGLDLFHEASMVDWEQMIDTNVKGLLYVTRAVLPAMVKRGSGHIINIGSISGRQVYAKGSVYCATKFAVRALTAGLREDLLGTGVRVSTVDPGMVETEFSQVRFKENNEKASAVYENCQPLTADDVATSVVFCASQPPHVTIAEMLVLPTDQCSASRVHRKTNEESL